MYTISPVELIVLVVVVTVYGVKAKAAPLLKTAQTMDNYDRVKQPKIERFKNSSTTIGSGQSICALKWKATGVRLFKPIDLSLYR